MNTQDQNALAALPVGTLIHLHSSSSGDIRGLFQRIDLGNQIVTIASRDFDPSNRAHPSFVSKDFSLSHFDSWRTVDSESKPHLIEEENYRIDDL
jgi:hypothetical protein